MLAASFTSLMAWARPSAMRMEASRSPSALRMADALPIALGRWIVASLCCSEASNSPAANSRIERRSCSAVFCSARILISSGGSDQHDLDLAHDKAPSLAKSLSTRCRLLAIFSRPQGSRQASGRRIPGAVGHRELMDSALSHVVERALIEVSPPFGRTHTAVHGSRRWVPVITGCGGMSIVCSRTSRTRTRLKNGICTPSPGMTNPT